MTRKILPFFLAVCLVCALTGCMGRGNESSVSSTVSATNKPTPTPEVSALPDASEGSGTQSPGAEGSATEASGENSGTSSGTASGTQDLGSFGPFREALQGVYGEKYAPDTRLTDEQIRTELGLDETLYEEVFAENVSGGKSPDTFIAVKAKEGKTKEIEEKLNAYKEKLAGDEAMAPHAEKINAAQVFSEGDYVFFLLTGEAAEGENSEGMAEALGNEVQRGIDAIKEALNMR